MRGFRLFERPVGAFVTLPPLQVVGSLASFEEGEPYEGRLDIVGAVGRCHVEIVEEDSYLPPGSYAYVDNFNQQVVLKWPAYRPPAPTDDEIINPSFEEGLEGWVDLRGNSWGVEVYDDSPESGHPPNNNPPTQLGNKAAYMRGAGRGDHILESIQYPVEPGQYITARSLWDQGPSNKDNNNLWTALGLYRDGQFIEEVRGDRIHDRTNKERHWSIVDHLIQPGIDAVTVRLIAHRRNGRNRVIIVDDVRTTGLRYETGNDDQYDFYFVKFKVTDSANRVAYWDGVITSAVSLLLTTPPYPIVAVDELWSSASITNIGTLGAMGESFLSMASVVAMELEVTQRDMNYEHAPGDDISSTALIAGLELVPTVIYTSYDHEGDDFISSEAAVSALEMEVTAAYINYDAAEPDDAITSTATITGLELQ